MKKARIVQHRVPSYSHDYFLVGTKTVGIGTKVPVFGVPWDPRKRRASTLRLAVSVWPLKRVIVVCIKFNSFQLFLDALVAQLWPLVVLVALVTLAHRK